MSTKLVQPAAGRKRLRHDAEFKAQIVAASLRPGVSIAAVVMAKGINSNDGIDGLSLRIQNALRHSLRWICLRLSQPAQDATEVVDL